MRHEKSYLRRMKTAVLFLLLLLMIGVVGVLLAGMLGLARGGGDPRRSNKLMQWRIILQAGAILVFIVLMTLVSSS